MVRVTNLNELSSDHNPILLEISNSPIRSSPPRPRKLINWKKFQETLAHDKQSPNLPTKNIQEIDSAILNLSTTIQNALVENSYLPNRTKDYNKTPEYIKIEIAEKNRLRREWQNIRDPQIKTQLNGKIKRIRTILATERQDEWDKHIDKIKHDNNSIYKLNRNLLKKTPAIHPLQGPNGLIYAPEEKVELLADSLESQFAPNPGAERDEVTREINIIRSINIQSTGTYITPGTIKQIINRLQNKKAPGEDSSPNAAMKFLPENKLLALTKIYNSCLRISYYPRAWREAITISIPKPGKDPKIPENYRPISLLSTLSKIFERLILQHLQKDVLRKIRGEQFAFRPAHSTT